MDEEEKLDQSLGDMDTVCDHIPLGVEMLGQHILADICCSEDPMDGKKLEQFEVVAHLYDLHCLGERYPIISSEHPDGLNDEERRH